MLKEEMRKIMNKADIAHMGSIIEYSEDEYDLEINLILQKINKDIDIFTLKNIVYEVFKYCFCESIIYDKNDDVYNMVAKNIFKLIKRSNLI